MILNITFKAICTKYKQHIANIPEEMRFEEESISFDFFTVFQISPSIVVRHDSHFPIPESVDEEEQPCEKGKLGERMREEGGRRKDEG